MSLPGDPDKSTDLARMLRVDHAGERGAVRIYEGQLAVLPEGPARAAVARMAAQEQTHLAAFEAMLPAGRVRPTMLTPLWDAAGFALGAASAALGANAAMAVTVAIEDVIDEHYGEQIARLDDGALRQTLEKFRADERAHRDEALAHGALATPGYEVLTTAVKAGSRLAIWLSTRL